MSKAITTAHNKRLKNDLILVAAIIGCVLYGIAYIFFLQLDARMKSQIPLSETKWAVSDTTYAASVSSEEQLQAGLFSNHPELTVYYSSDSEITVDITMDELPLTTGKFIVYFDDDKVSTATMDYKGRYKDDAGDAMAIYEYEDSERLLEAMANHDIMRAVFETNGGSQELIFDIRGGYHIAYMMKIASMDKYHTGNVEH